MPELPDLQIFSKNLHLALAGKKLQRIKIINKSKLKSSLQKIKKAVEGNRIKKIYREGKEIHFLFANNNVLGFHMMLRGRLHYFDENNSHKYTIVELYFNEAPGLALTDYQGNANVTLNPIMKDSPDALSKEVNYKFLKEKLGRKATIKNVLLDQDVIRGIGNAYADEILWNARISPFSISAKIPSAKVKALARSIKSVLAQAAKKIDRAEPGIIGGEIRDFLDIHNSRKKKSPAGATIRVSTSGSRKTYYTNEQELYK